MIKKEAVVIHSGGMDSSICLALACKEFGPENVLSLTFSYSQRHSIEIEKAAKISNTWGVDNCHLTIECLQKITDNALTNRNLKIQKSENGDPNTLVVGRNGLMGRIGAIHADSLGANCIYMGVIEVEGSNSGYRDCSRKYIDLLQEILRIDLNNPLFEIRTPLVKMSKKETMEVAYELGVLEFLLNETVTCYEGMLKKGCGVCPSCLLRNEGIESFKREHPDILLPY